MTPEIVILQERTGEPDVVKKRLTNEQAKILADAIRDGIDKKIDSGEVSVKSGMHIRGLAQALDPQ